MKNNNQIYQPGRFPLKSPKNYFFQRSIFSLPLEVQENTILIMARFKGLNEFRRLSSSNRIPCMCVNPFLFSRYSSPPLYGIQFLSKWSYRRVIASSFRGNDLSLSLSLVWIYLSYTLTSIGCCKRVCIEVVLKNRR